MECDCVILNSDMKVVAAYLLAVLGGNPSPSAGDIKNILSAGFFSQSQIFFTFYFFTIFRNFPFAVVVLCFIFTCHSFSC